MALSGEWLCPWFWVMLVVRPIQKLVLGWGYVAYEALSSRFLMPRNWESDLFGGNDEGRMKGKVCIVTGASGGIGLTTAEGLARMGAHVIMACRNLERSTPLAEKLKRETGNDKVEVMQVDLNNLRSVRTFALKFIERKLPLHVLINNAGILATPYTLSADGIESQFAVNYLSHYLLTCLLHPALTAAKPSRVVNVSSVMHKLADFDIEDPNTGKPTLHHILSEDKYSGFRGYSNSKLAIILSTYNTNRQWSKDGVFVSVVHPGEVYTGVAREFHPVIRFLYDTVAKCVLRTPMEGAATTLYAATSPELEGKGGLYLKDYNDVTKSSGLSYDETLQTELDRLSTALVKSLDLS